MYAIKNLCPRTDIVMGAHGFSIDLAPGWLELVRASKINESRVEARLRASGNLWLDACGYGLMYDPDERLDLQLGPEQHRKKLGPNARRLYDVHSGAIRVVWGKWGCELISVPGSACDLHIEHNALGSCFDGGAQLLPHNVDCWSQKQLLLIIFTEFAEDILMFANHNVR